MIGWHKDIFDGAAWDNHHESSGFRNNWLNPEFRRFFDENIYNHFTITFGFIFLVHLVVIFLYIIVKILHSAARKKTLPAYFNTLSVD